MKESTEGRSKRTLESEVGTDEAWRWAACRGERWARAYRKRGELLERGSCRPGRIDIDIVIERRVERNDIVIVGHDVVVWNDILERHHVFEWHHRRTTASTRDAHRRDQEP